MAYDRASDRALDAPRGRGDTARRAVGITGSGSDLAIYAVALYIATAGDVTVIPVNTPADTPVTFAAHPVGYLQVQCRRVTACPAGTVALFD